MIRTLFGRRQQVLDRLIDGPRGQEALAQIEAEELVRRKAAVAEIARLTKERDAAVPQLQAAEDAARADVAKAEAALAAAKSRLLAADADRTAASNLYEVRIRHQHAVLRELAPLAIDELIADLRRVENSLMGAATWTPNAAAPRYENEAELHRSAAAAHEAHTRRLETVRGALAAADALKETALAGPDLERRLAELRAAADAPRAG